MGSRYELFQPLLTESGLSRFALSLQQRAASEPLAGIVHSFLQITATRPTLYPMIPDGTQAVFIGPNSVHLRGAQTKTLDLPITEPGKYFGIQFYPGTLRHFFREDLSDITDRFVDGSYWPCRQFAQLQQPIFNQARFAKRAEECEKWLLQRIQPSVTHAFDRALSEVYKSLGGVNVNVLAEKVGLSRRHLNRLFQRYVGLSTKTFSQTVRVQAACRALFNDPSSSLKTAVDLGFFDQAHLLREYKKSLLLSPRSLFTRFRSDLYNR